jgi:hypothetical protein
LDTPRIRGAARLIRIHVIADARPISKSAVCFPNQCRLLGHAALLLDTILSHGPNEAGHTIIEVVLRRQVHTEP